MFTYAFQQSTSVLPINRKPWLHVETGCPNDRDTLLFHLPPALHHCCLPLLSVRVYNITMSMCYACEGSVTACFPLSYHSCPTHTLHPVRLPANKRERESGRTGGEKKSWRNTKRTRRRRIGESQSWAQKWCKTTKSQIWTAVCVALCSHGELPAGRSLSAVHRAGKGVSFGSGWLRVWRWRVMLLWFHNSCTEYMLMQKMFTSLNLFRAHKYTENDLSTFLIYEMSFLIYINLCFYRTSY